MEKEKYILVVNQFNCDNLGDNLLNEVLCHNLAKKGFRTIINCGFAQTQPQEVLYNKEDINKKNINNIMKEKVPEHIKYIIKYKRRLRKETQNLDIQNCLCMILGGGQLLKRDSVFLDCLRYWVTWATRNNIPVYLFGIGIDTGLNASEIKKYRSILSNVRYINCRNFESKEIICNDLRLSNVSVSPDIAFLLDEEPKERNNNILVMPYSYRTAIRAFDFRQTKQEYYNSIFQMIKEIGGNNQVILGATTTADADECLRFCSFLKKHGIDSNISEITSVGKLVSIIASSKYVITGRMHAMIISKVMNTPVIPIIISDKIKQFAKEYLDNFREIDSIKELTEAGLDELINQIRRI